MKAAYDHYDYKKYWVGREYEHKSEVKALKKLLKKINRKDLEILEIGGGFGRLVHVYLPFAKKAILTDPSSTLLKHAREENKSQNLVIKTLKAEEISKITQHSKKDLILMIRVLHHIKDIDQLFFSINKSLKPGGYFILEFANKVHGKSTIRQVISGNTTYLWDIFPIDIRSKRNKAKKTIPFINYHPDFIQDKLKNSNFRIVKKLSVSNLRSSQLKKLLPLDTLVNLESRLQKPFSSLNFGPSIFVLAQKRKSL